MSEARTKRRITHDVDWSVGAAGICIREADWEGPMEGHGGRLGSGKSLCGKTVCADVVAMFDKSSSVVKTDMNWGRLLDRGVTFSCNMDDETSLSNPLMVSVR